MSNPLFGAFLSITMAQAGQAYIEKHGHSNFIIRWGTALLWASALPAAMAVVAPFFKESPGAPTEVLRLSQFLLMHAIFFVGGLVWSSAVTRPGRQPPTPWRVKGRFIAWWSTLVLGWMLVLHLMIGIAWMIAMLAGTEPFLVYGKLIHDEALSTWQGSSIYWCFWIAFGLNIYAWRRSGKLVPKEASDSDKIASQNAVQEDIASVNGVRHD